MALHRRLPAAPSAVVAFAVVLLVALPAVGPTVTGAVTGTGLSPGLDLVADTTSGAFPPPGCTPTPGAPNPAVTIGSAGPVFLTCEVSFPGGTVTGSAGSGVTVTAPEGTSVVAARVWDNRIDVVLPAGYDPAWRYPVLYLLHGAGDTYRSWEANTDLDTYLVEHPAVDPFIVVMPDGGADAHAGWYSDWLDGEWQYETFDTVLLTRYVDATFSTRPDDLAIAGLSMGGFGALSLAGRHPGMFKVAASFSGAVDTLYGAPISGVAFDELNASYGTPTTAVWGDQTADRAIWEAHDPAYLAPQLAGTTILLACGTGTPGGPEGDALDPTGSFDPGGYAIENAVFQMNLSLLRALHAAGVASTDDFYLGGYHGWPYWQADLHWALPIMASVVGPPVAAGG